MPARELLTLAERWRDHPTGAAQDGELLAATRSTLASLDGRERAVLGEQLRIQGAEQLADRLEASDRLPVWSDEFTGVARDLLSLDPVTLADLVEVADPDAVSALAPPVGRPVDLPPPSPPDPSLAATPDAAGAPAGEEVEVDAPDPSDGPDGPLETAEPAEPSPQTPDLDVPPALEAASPDAASPAWEARRWQPRDPSGTTSRVTAPVRTDAAGGAVVRARRGEAAAPSLAPGVRSSLVARTRFLELDERIAAGLTAATARELIAEAPDGWQRRRVVLRLLDADPVDLDATAILGSLARPADRTVVADRLVRHGAATLAEVTPHLTASAAARLRRRHG